MKIIVKIEDKWIKLDLYKDKINDEICNLCSPELFTSSKPFFKVTHEDKDYFVNPACIQYLINEE